MVMEDTPLKKFGVWSIRKGTFYVNGRFRRKEEISLLFLSHNQHCKILDSSWIISGNATSLALVDVNPLISQRIQPSRDCTGNIISLITFRSFFISVIIFNINDAAVAESHPIKGVVFVSDIALFRFGVTKCSPKMG